MSAVPWAARTSHGYSIGEVLEQLADQFPALTISKLRYLEDQGLLAPARTPTGFRRYSDADMERLRFVLTQQREHFLPLKVIRRRLEAMAASGVTAVPAGSPRAVRPVQVGREDVATVTGQPPQAVAAVAKAMGVSPDGSADAALVAAVESVAELAAHGLELRHLAPVIKAAAKQADLVEAAANAVRGRGSTGRERAAAVAHDAASAIARLNAAAVRIELSKRGL
jgi:DNA-binding transcriptional MerR regulator